MTFDKGSYEKRMLEQAANEPLNDPHDLLAEDQKNLFFYGKTFVPMKAVDFLLSMLPLGYFITPLSHKRESTIGVYQDYTGIYEPYGINWIQKTMQEQLGEESTTTRQNEVVQQIRIKTYDWDNEFNTEAPDFVILMNGAFNKTERKLYSYSPAYKAKARLPVYYDPDADCPAIKKFMSEVFHEDDILLMQEWMGYHLVTGYPFAKILFLIGDGANGKTTFLNLLTAILGTKNVSKKTLFDLKADKFAIAELYGKLANISPDVSEDERKHSGKLKALTGNDEIDARAIYQSSFKYKPQAKLSAAANKPPKTPDVTLAWFRRQLFVICDRVFTPEEADPYILESLTTREELSGVFNWMLDGMDRLLKTGLFSRNETPDEIQEKYDLMSDPVSAFIEDCVIHKAGATYEKHGFSRIRGDRVPTWNGITLDLDSRVKWEGGKGGKSGSTSITRVRKNSGGSGIDTPTTATTLTSSTPSDGTQNQDKDLIDLVKQGLSNNAGKSPSAEVVKWLTAGGYSFDDFRRLKTYTDIFKVEKQVVILLDEPMKDLIPWTETLVKKAINVLKLNGGSMLKKSLWENLELQGIYQKEAEPVLRSRPEFLFNRDALNVYLKEDS